MYSGSMVGAGAMAFALMPYCIANARPDEDCTVDLNPQILAAVFGEAKESIEKAISYLCAPDPLSRSKDCEGRRLVHVGPGPYRYRVVNLEKYREDSNSDDRREYWRQYRAWERKGRKGKFKLCSPSSHPVHTPCSHDVQSTDADADADASVLPSGVVGHSPDATRKEPKTEKALTSARVLIRYLNEKAGRKFTETDSNLRLVQCRINDVEGDLDGCKKMIARQVERWGNDPKMREYLRIETLFRASKFISYYDNRDLPVIHETDQRNNQRSAPNRNEGTFNDGDGSKYEHIGKVE